MSDSNLEDQLEITREQVSQEEFVQILLDYLNRNPKDEDREILEVWLQVHSRQDERMIDYWNRILNSDDPRRQEQAASNLLVKCLTGNVLACKILRDFLGEEPSFETLNAWRIRQLGFDKYLTE